MKYIAVTNNPKANAPAMNMAMLSLFLGAAAWLMINLINGSDWSLPRLVAFNEASFD